MPDSQHTNSPYWSLYISYSASWENLFKIQGNFFLMIPSVILTASTHDHVLI